jgi:hypothetical protein
MALKKYGSQTPGYLLALSPELEKQAFSILGRRTVLFPGKDPQVSIGTDNADDPNSKFYADLQKYIENSKPFKAGVIFRVPTERELAEQKKKQEQAEYLKVLKDQRKAGILPLEDYPKDALFTLAEKAGVPTSGKGVTEKVVRENLIKLVDSK